MVPFETVQDFVEELRQLARQALDLAGELLVETKHSQLLTSHHKEQRLDRVGLAEEEPHLVVPGAFVELLPELGEGSHNQRPGVFFL